MPTNVLPPMPVEVKAQPPVSVTVDGGSLGIAGGAHIFNIAIAAANVEQSMTLPPGTKAFELKTRGNSGARIAYVSGGTNDLPTPAYISIPAASAYSKDQLNATGVVIYFQTTKVPEVVQVTAWV